MHYELISAIGGAPLQGNLQGSIHNAIGKLHDGWWHSGAQAGVQLNLKHTRGIANYAADQHFRAALAAESHNAKKHAVGQGASPADIISDRQQGQPGNTPARRVRSRPATGRKTFVSTTTG